MPQDLGGIKWSCEPCIRGHRASKCQHFERPMVRVKKPGRPLRGCPHGPIGCDCAEEAQYMMVRIPTESETDCLCKATHKIGQPEGFLLKLGEDHSLATGAGIRQPQLSVPNSESYPYFIPQPDFQAPHQPARDQAQSYQQPQVHQAHQAQIYDFNAMPPYSYSMNGQEPYPGIDNDDFEPQGLEGLLMADQTMSNQESFATHTPFNAEPVTLRSGHPTIDQVLDAMITQPELSCSESGKSGGFVPTGSPVSINGFLREKSQDNYDTVAIDSSAINLNHNQQNTDLSTSHSGLADALAHTHSNHTAANVVVENPETLKTRLASGMSGHDFPQYMPHRIAHGLAEPAESSVDLNIVIDGEFSPPGCNCGPGCECVFCALHPYNSATRQRVRELASIMAADFNASPESRPRSLDGADIQASVRQDYYADQLGNSDDSTPMQGSVLQSDVKNSNDAAGNAYAFTGYHTLQYSMLPDCGNDEGMCSCGNDCKCNGCTTHWGHDGMPLEHAQPKELQFTEFAGEAGGERIGPFGPDRARTIEAINHSEINH